MKNDKELYYFSGSYALYALQLVLCVRLTTS